MHTLFSVQPLQGRSTNEFEAHSEVVVYTQRWPCHWRGGRQGVRRTSWFRRRCALLFVTLSVAVRVEQ